MEVILMNITNRIKLQTQYSDLKKLIIDKGLLEQALNDKDFAELYNRAIKPFIKYLYNYKYTDYNGVEKKLDTEMISHHVSSILKTYKNNNIKYISFVKDNAMENEKIENAEVLNDKNFEILFNLIGIRIFYNNIADIITKGYSERLLNFIKNNPRFNLELASINLFDEKVWNIINSNPAIGNTTILDLFGGSIDGLNTLIGIISAGVFEGLKETYEKIPQSHGFIKHYLISMQANGLLLTKPFNINFIKSIGIDVLETLYGWNCFSNEKEFKKIFEIYEAGNLELIKDIVNFHKKREKFYIGNIPDEDTKKDLLETNINEGYFTKNELLLNKYFGIEWSDNHYIKLFLSAINKTPLTDEFKKKYGTILDLLNQVYNASDKEIIAISKKLNKDKKEEYKKFIYDCEKDGNELIKIQFCKDLKERNIQQLNNIPYNPIKTNSENSINIYKLTGQPFTMLVHGITDNDMSSNNAFVKEIINNPESWNSITEGNNFISTSLITNQHMVTYGIPNNENTIMFGFYRIPPQSIKFMCPYDSGLNRNAAAKLTFNMRDQLHVPTINTVVSIDELIKKTIDKGMKEWNEIGISRSNEQTGKKLQPDYIVCMDHVSENSKRAAEYFGIPIFLIDRRYYKQLSDISENNLTDQVQEENYDSTGIHR